MSINFKSSNFENPAIQKFYAGLQAFALNEKKPEEIQDTLEPDYEGMKNMSKVIDKMKQTFFDGATEDHLAAEKPKSVGGRKRMFEDIDSVQDGVEGM